MYGWSAWVMETTASYSAAWRMAKLRVAWTVAGWAPEVPTILISSRFQSTTDLPEPGAVATGEISRRAAAASVPEAAGATPPIRTPPPHTPRAFLHRPTP